MLHFFPPSALRSLARTLALFTLALSTAQAEPRHGGSLTFLVEQEPPVLLPLTTTGAVSQIGPKIVEGLVSAGFGLEPKPSLATAWTVSPDGLTYTFQLRQGVKWHDGKPFTSADVVYSLNTLREVNPADRGLFANFTGVEAPTDHSVVIRLSKPAPYLLLALDSYTSPIVPKHLYDGTDPRTNPRNTAPVGTGPFVFKKWERGNYILLERNPDYWDKPKPWLDQLVIRFIPDKAARTVALETGQVDLAGGTSVLLNDVERLRNNPLLDTETKGYEYTGSQNELFFNFENTILRDRRVRQAIGHAIDLDQFIKIGYLGYALPSPTPISAQQPKFRDPGLKPYAFDLERANALLDEAGYPRKADGVRFRLRLLYNPYHDRKIANLTRQALLRVGIATELSVYDFATYVKHAYTDRDWDLTLEVLANFFDPVSGVQRIYWSRNFQVGLPFSNASAYRNPEVDRLLEAAAVETDVEKRVALYRQFQQVIYQDVAAINLVSPEYITVASKRVKNHTVTATGVAGSFADVYVTGD